MSILPVIADAGPTPSYVPVEFLPDYDSLITEDETPVDGIYSERQHRLLTDTLHVSWKGRGDNRPRWVSTDVALFFSDLEPPLAPDVMISLDVTPPQDPFPKKNRSYFIWRFGKPPDGIVEVVSNLKGGELTIKLEAYARIHVPYYVVWDPFLYLGEQALYCFKLDGTKFAPCDPWFPDLYLGVTAWDGEYDGITNRWLRWCDQQGRILPSGVELAAAEKHRAEAAEQRAETAEQRAMKLAEKLHSLGIDPDA